ncbi:DUF6503 family protein [Salegentibacter chungangensis]|uniref:DUF6503 family protein n=1 Tax=Salegentibacter chungangensis TaxID=1335724 RepID=A0ABW3NQV0_9FLAO
MKYLNLIIIVLLFISCDQENKKEELTAEKIVERAIDTAGGQNYEYAEIDFVFRDRNYKSFREGGKYRLERIQQDSTGKMIHDILSNEGLQRKVNDSTVQVADSLVTPISNGVNSVHYFVQLPYGLNAPAANKKLIGKDSIAGKEYYEVKVTFNAEGGGTDHEDEYLYWIDTKHYTVDYLAYNYEVNGGGIRFRKAYNERKIEGLRFVDYKNYKYAELGTPLKKLDSLYEEGELELLSTIENKDIKVNISK